MHRSLSEKFGVKYFWLVKYEHIYKNLFTKSNKTSNWNICPRLVGPGEMCVQKADVLTGKPEWRMQN
jgi:hypothetical protein